jgi:hypothetical protein
MVNGRLDTKGGSRLRARHVLAPVTEMSLQVAPTSGTVISEAASSLLRMKKVLVSACGASTFGVSSALRR